MLSVCSILLATGIQPCNFDIISIFFFLRFQAQPSYTKHSYSSRLLATECGTMGRDVHTGCAQWCGEAAKLCHLNQGIDVHKGWPMGTISCGEFLGGRKYIFMQMQCPVFWEQQFYAPIMCVWQRGTCLELGRHCVYLEGLSLICSKKK